MHQLMDLLRSNGPLLILSIAFLETLGLPLPAFPFIVLAGCIITEDSIAWPSIALAAIAGTVTADLFWFWLGRRLGRKPLALLCKLSLNPDACMGRSEKLFYKRSTAVILLAKLIPGLNTLVPSLAGILGMKPLRYALLDAAGSLIWVGSGLGLGLVFGRGVLPHLAGVQRMLLLLLAAMLGFYIIFRIGYRYYLTKRRSIPRIHVDELQEKIASDNGIVVIDLRNSLEYSDSTQMLPGAHRIAPSDFEMIIDSLPKDKEIVLYCT
jgi:membrane protein DedA with SNARE-associated domain